MQSLISRRFAVVSLMFVLLACSDKVTSRRGGDGAGGAEAEQTGGRNSLGGAGGTVSGGAGGRTGGSGGTLTVGTGGTSTTTTGGAGGVSGGTAGGVTGGAGGRAGTGGMPSGGTGGTTASDKIVYTFESGPDGWAMSLGSKEMGWPDPTHVKGKGELGTGALEYAIDPALGTTFYVGVEGRSIVRPVKRITYNLFLPVDHGITHVEAFILGFDSPQGRKWESINQGKFPFVPGGWTKFVLEFETPYPVGLWGHAVGFMLVSDAIWKGSVYIDNVEIEMVPGN